MAKKIESSYALLLTKGRPMLRNLPLFCLTASLSVLVILKAGAQSITSGDIAGVVTDPSEARVPNAMVTLTNVSTNAKQSAATSLEGTYRFAFLLPGIYDVAVKAAGFQPQQRSHIVVTAGQPAAADFQLQLAESPQIVEVFGGAMYCRLRTRMYRPPTPLRCSKACRTRAAI